MNNAKSNKINEVTYIYEKKKNMLVYINIRNITSKPFFDIFICMNKFGE